MKIKDLPDSSKPRERFLKHGPEALSDAELFAIILRTGTRNKKDENGELMPGENVIDMSNRLLKEYGLNSLFDCSLNELQKIKGIGPSKAMQILAMAELGKRHSQSRNPIKKINCAKDVFDYFHERLKDEKQEHFYILMLNNKNHIIGEKFLFKGTIDASLIEPNEIFRSAIKDSSKRIILIHNHPSGDPNPSDEDIEITHKLIEAGKMLNIQVLDHVIIGNESYWNWKEQ